MRSLDPQPVSSWWLAPVVARGCPQDRRFTVTAVSLRSTIVRHRVTQVWTGAAGGAHRCPMDIVVVNLYFIAIALGFTLYGVLIWQVFIEL